MTSKFILLITFAVLLFCLLENVDATRSGKRKAKARGSAKHKEQINKKIKTAAGAPKMPTPVIPGTKSVLPDLVQKMKPEMKEVQAHLIANVKKASHLTDPSLKNETFVEFMKKFETATLAGKPHSQNDLTKKGIKAAKKKERKERMQLEALFAELEMTKIIHRWKLEPTEMHKAMQNLKKQITTPLIRATIFDMIHKELHNNKNEKDTSKVKTRINIGIDMAFPSLKKDMALMVKEYKKHGGAQLTELHIPAKTGNFNPVPGPTPIRKGVDKHNNLGALSHEESLSRSSSGNSSSDLPKSPIKRYKAVGGDVADELDKPKRVETNMYPEGPKKLNGDGANIETDPIRGIEQEDASFGKFKAEASERFDEDKSESEIKKEIDETNEPENDDIQKKETSEDTDPIKLPSSVVDEEPGNSDQTNMVEAEERDEHAEKLASSAKVKDGTKTNQKMREETSKNGEEEKPMDE